MTVKEESTPKVEKTDKNTKKTTAKKQSSKKKVLIDLVEQSGVDEISIIMDLSKHELLEQYHDEIRLKNLGVPIKPSITENEFKKIIGD